MAYKVLLTSLYEVERKSPIVYFYAKENKRNYFCDAMISAEAITKYVLARYDVDEIIALGNWPAFDENDSSEIMIRDGMDYFTSDLGGLSAFSLFNYRLAQYLDDLRIDEQDLADLIEPDKQAKIVGFVNGFCKSGEEANRLSRLFEDLAVDKTLYQKFRDGLEEIADDEASLEKMLLWTKGYLYKKLKDTCKLDILRENTDVKVSYVSASLPDDGSLPVDSMLKTMQYIMDTGRDEIDIMVALGNNDVTGNFVLMNLLDIADKLFGQKIEVTNIFDTVEGVNAIADVIRDDTSNYGITELTAAMSTFLRYGKADMLIEFWEKKGYHNESVERLIYSMKKIDNGLSLCSISDMEDGIRAIKKLFREKEGESFPDDVQGKMFHVFAEGVKMDYGKLMEGDDIDFIEMVKWGYRKNFLQQTLTLIESRATKEFIGRGIFYYCNDEDDKQRCVDILAGERNQLKPYEYWKMDDIDHYFIKLYIRKEGKRGSVDPQLLYARRRVKFIDNEDPEKLNAYTACDDRKIVENLLYAYYHVGDIRNYINHADEGLGRDTSLMPSEKEESKRLINIREAIEFFINCYDTAIANIGDKELDVVRIYSGEVKVAAKRLEEEEKVRKEAEKERRDAERDSGKE